MSAKQQRGLGRGLQALIGFEETAMDERRAGETGVRLVDILRIDPNPNQARKRFDKEALEGLARSIEIHGVIQPLIVGEQGDRFRLIAGERHPVRLYFADPLESLAFPNAPTCTNRGSLIRFICPK